jgi:TolB-like protein/DNA-binding SARP family transcriptional activator
MAAVAVNMLGSGSVTRLRGGEAARIYLVGAMRVVAPGGEDLLPRARKTRALLAYICLAQGERIPRSRLLGLLWDRSAEAQARMSLRHALSELNDRLNHQVPGLIEIDREAVRLNTRACWIDVFAIPDHSERLLEDFDGISPAFDQWLAVERIRFEDSLRGILETELNRLIEEDAAPELRAAAARRLINFEPTHEGAVRSVMTAFAQMGDRAQAIREFERCRQALRTMLDLPPAKETVALYEAVRLVFSNRTAARPAAESPPEATEAPPGRLETRPTLATDSGGQPPTIAVLPFRNLSGEVGHDYAADGLAEDLIEALSRVPNFFVISRLSTLAFRNQDRLPQEIGEVLGVRYVLSGSMRVLGDRLRLTVELTDTRRGAALWSSRLDERFFDLFEVQDRLAEAIVRRVAPYLHTVELKRARIKHPDHLEAYELFLRAQENMHNSSRAIFETCEALYDKAIAQEPRYATALAWRARWHLLRVAQGWSPDPAQDAKQADHFARRAIECDGTEPMAYAVHGHIASYLQRDFEVALRRFETALHINPNAAPAWCWSAGARAFMGDGPRAVAEINKALALSPYDPLMHVYSGIAAMAYVADGQYDRAVECALRSLRENRSYTAGYKVLAFALVLAGREAEAQAPVGQLLKLEPDFTVAKFRQRSPTSAGPNGELYCSALAAAGVPLSG